MRRIHFILLTLIALSCSKNKNQSSNDSSQNGNRILISELSNTNKDIFPNQILEKCKGKIVYVDIWATWCRPCLAEAPFSKTLQSKYQGKNIAFINICCASKQETWEKTIADHDIPGEHHLLSDEQCMNLKEKFQLVSFPTYMIFDKNGALLYGDAPRPSSELIEGILNGLIDK